MKLVFAIVHDEDTQAVSDNLNGKGFSVTRLSSSGGFLKSGNSTLLVGVGKEKVDEVIKIIEQYSTSRKQKVVNKEIDKMDTNRFIPKANEVTVGGATVFVVDVDQYLKL